MAAGVATLSMSELRILFFALLKERLGKPEITLLVEDGLTVGKLKARLEAAYPTLRPWLKVALISVNRQYASDEDAIPADAEVAVFPPVSGGDGVDLPTRCEVADNEIDLNALLQEITLPSTGAACFFAGMVRGRTERDHLVETSYLEYEAYKPMAEEKLRQIAAEIRRLWPAVQGIALVQRIGRLPAGTATVVIACTAAHRDSGVFEAARYGIDRLKQIVPVWKKEVGSTGETWVEGEYLPSPGE